MEGAPDVSLLDDLMETGLTRHEARLYILLATEVSLTGYEAAKLTGMSRSNAYLSLAGLTEKGGAACVDGDVRRYSAVPADEFCQNKKQHFDAVLKSIEDRMPAPRAAAEPFLTIKGRVNIVNKMRHLIRQTEKRIYLSLAAEELAVVLEDLRSVIEKKLKVVVITEAPFELPGITVYYTEKKQGQIRLIVDSEWVLTGEISRNSESTCLFSRHQALVSLFKESMINEIRLISMTSQPPDKGETT